MSLAMIMYSEIFVIVFCVILMSSTILAYMYHNKVNKESIPTSVLGLPIFPISTYNENLIGHNTSMRIPTRAQYLSVVSQVREHRRRLDLNITSVMSTPGELVIPRSDVNQNVPPFTSGGTAPSFDPQEASSPPKGMSIETCIILNDMLRHYEFKP